MTKGAEGYAPDYLPLVNAARFWQVGPYELMHQSRYWVDVAVQVSEAEAHKRKIDEQVSARRAKRAKRGKR